MLKLTGMSIPAIVLAGLLVTPVAAEDPPDVSGQPNEKLETSLHGPVADAKVEEVKALLAGGANVNAVDEYGQTPLHKATYPNFRNPGHLEIAGLLLKNGADANATSLGGGTPLHMAEAEFVDLLVKHGADVDAVDVNGQTALHHAAWGDRTEKVKKLLKAGADATIKDKNGRTALDRAMVTTDYPRPPEIEKMLKRAMRKAEKKKQ